MTGLLPMPKMPANPIAIVCAVLCMLAAGPAAALDADREEVTTFVAEMAGQHGFDATALSGLFTQVVSQSSIIEAMS